MQVSVQLERVGKLKPADRVATSSSAGIQNCRNLRLFVTDKNTGLRFLVDSGADISIIPPKDKNRMPRSDYKLYAANGTEIVTYGTKVRNLDIGLRRQFQWPFVIANTNRAIIGADFLSNFGLIIDMKNKRLIDGITNLSIRGVIQSISDMGNISTLNSSSKVSAILTKYPNLCRPPSDFVEAKHSVKHYIPTRGQPIHSKARRLDSQRLTLAKAEFQYIRLNAVTLPDRYPIPRLDDFHHILKGTRVYSKIDLCKAFYQIPIAEEDKPKTAIITPFGLFEFNVMSFGLRNAAATFQRFMHEVLRNLDFAFVYLDDILVASKTEEEHYSHLETLFSRLNSYGLRINLSKSKFLVQEIDFLGYLITSHETQAILHEYLRGAKKKDRSEIKWTKEAEVQFEKCKQALANTALLAYPDTELPISLCTDNIVADALSRVDAITTIDYKEIAKEQTGDSELQNLISKTTSLKFKQCPLQSGKLLWCDVSTNNIRPFIPIKFRMMVFRNFHELSHPGIKATTKQLTSRFIWPNMNKDIRKWAQACVNCQKCMVSIHTKSEIGKYQEVDESFSVIDIDLIGPLPLSNGNIYCLTCIDRYTSWKEVVPLPDMKSETVARAFYENWIVRFGAPHTVISDQGKQFTSQLFKDLTTLCGIKLRHSTAYHPQCNGKIERLHRTIKTAIRAHNSIKWTETLPTVLLGLRAVLSTKITTILCLRWYMAKPSDCLANSLMLLNITCMLKNLTDRVKKPLEPPYEGPFPVLERTDKYFTLKVKGKNVTTSIDRLRPAYLLADSDNITAEHPTATRPIVSGALPSTSSQQNPDPPDVEKYTEFQGTGSAPDLPRTRSGRIIKKPSGMDPGGALNIRNRQHQTTLTRFRTGHLKTLKMENNNKIYSTCPKCSLVPTAPEHILACIGCTEQYLWERPLLIIKQLEEHELMEFVPTLQTTQRLPRTTTQVELLFSGSISRPYHWWDDTRDLPEEKCDLSKLAYELGEVVPPESRIVDLKRLILNSQSYEEEFAKQLLETLIEEREQTERAERERMEQTAQTEQAERIERERIEDRKRIEDRERIERKEQMVMEFELEKLRIQTTRGNNDTSRSTSNDAHYEIRKLMPKYESKDNDLSFYLILFERQAKRLGLDEDQWAFSLLGLLPYEMTQLIARETEEQSGDYRFVKRLLLKRYKLSPEQFRQKFEKHERSQKGSWRDFAFELRGYFNEWIEGMNVENFDALKDLSVTNQLKKKVPNVLRNHLIDDWTKLNNPDELADKLDEYENVRTEMGPPHWNAKHLIPPSFQQKSARFPNQSEVKETKQGTNVSGQDAARNEISETYPNTLRRMVNRAIRNDKGEPKCFNCNQFGHIARDCPAPRTTLTCRGCGQTGHKERNCTRPKEGLKVANLEVEGLETVPPDVYLKDVKIDNKETVKAMIDTGSSSCLMRESVARRISVDIKPDSTSLYGIGNQTAPAARTVGKTTVDLEIDGIVGREITVFIVNDDAQPYDLLIGRTWTDLPYVSFARIGKNLHIGYSSEFPFANLQEEIKSRRIELRATETVQLESDSINFTSAITDEVKDGYVLFTGVDDACVDSLLEVVDGKTTVPIISAGKGKLRVRKNQCVGRVELLNLDDIVVNLDVAEDSFQTKNEEKREGQDQMKRKRPILPEDINVNHSLTSKERQEILDVANEYRDCFALGMEELGCTDVTKMDIKEVDGSKPVCLRPYKTTASEREAIREIVREWKDNGIVTETRSPYASPVLLVRKKTGDHRLVVDYRRLNIQTVKDKFPLPRIDDLLEGLRNAKFFTTLDLAHGYLQIPLTDKAKLKTAFITPDDTGQFERMIFGLANAPAEFQRLMHTVLGPLLNKKAFCYLDDVIIPAKDWREMIERLREVLERIRSAKLTLKPSKCEFGRREVEFLGYVISTGGLKPGPRKIKAIEEFPEPKNVHDIRRFLGLTNFFRRFVKDFARKAEPLSRLTKKGSQFEWKEEQRRSFGGLRKDLVEYPVLAHYNPELKTEVHCDASAEGLAGMVLQMDENCKWRLVYCVSKKTTEAEKMYHSSKLELMAIVWTLDRLRQFLVGIKFTVVTDCQALVYMNAKKTTNPQIARWYNLIQEYDFEIRHKPGEKMAHVDGMSRAPVDDPRDTMEEIVEKNLEVCLTITLEEQILMIQHSDPELRDLIQIFRKDPCDRTVGEQNRINDYSYRRKSGRGARSRRYPPTQPTTFLQRKVQSRTTEIQEWPNHGSLKHRLCRLWRILTVRLLIEECRNQQADSLQDTTFFQQTKPKVKEENKNRKD
ncbi:hypothetical protein LAZ67_7002244 [Cordylochernes scorpioides]|uniref:RNA-directed DNA polymerase n=1 Tax=Cordylochernes scorpioides TaxID=51811 RepID=A0ABY6KR82_9ARAC|nr:hypothetical protein LAZ67_7002244 [Cordylochernes scorpioides]